MPTSLFCDQEQLDLLVTQCLLGYQRVAHCFAVKRLGAIHLFVLTFGRVVGELRLGEQLLVGFPVGVRQIGHFVHFVNHVVQMHQWLVLLNNILNVKYLTLELGGDEVLLFPADVFQ